MTLSQKMARFTWPCNNAWQNLSYGATKRHRDTSLAESDRTDLAASCLCSSVVKYWAYLRSMRTNDSRLFKYMLGGRLLELAIWSAKLSLYSMGVEKSRLEVSVDSSGSSAAGPLLAAALAPFPGAAFPVAATAYGIFASLASNSSSVAVFLSSQTFTSFFPLIFY